MFHDGHSLFQKLGLKRWKISRFQTMVIKRLSFLRDYFPFEPLLHVESVTEAFSHLLFGHIQQVIVFKSFIDTCGPLPIWCALMNRMERSIRQVQGGRHQEVKAKVEGHQENRITNLERILWIVCHFVAYIESLARFYRLLLIDGTCSGQSCAFYHLEINSNHTGDPCTTMAQHPVDSQITGWISMSHVAKSWSTNRLPRMTTQ